CNLVRIILGKKETSDSEQNNVYTRAAKYFADWRRDGVLKPDAEPSIYLYVQQFAVPGGTDRLERRGLFSSGRGKPSRTRTPFPTSRRFPSEKRTVWICCALPRLTSNRFSCCTAIRRLKLITH